MVRSRTRVVGEIPRLGRARSRISGTMSANALMRRYPKTEALFRRLQIDRQREGYESVDELVWRHGMDERYFFKQLRQLAKVFPDSRLIRE